MKKKIVVLVIIVIALFFVGKTFLLSGGAHNGKGQMPAAVVSVAKVNTKKIVSTKEYLGRVVAKDYVEMTARVTGTLMGTYFKEGDIVKKDQVLFYIDSDKITAAVEQAKADISNIEAALEESERNLIRAKELVEKDYISKSEYDSTLALRDKNRAALLAAKAVLKKANHDYKNSKIYAPVDGKISNIYITEGNLVGPDRGPLATLVSLNPIYVTYNVPADDFTKLRLKLASENKDLSDMKVKLTLSDGTPFPMEGKQDFFNNKIDETTGTIQMRATFPNPEGILLPGALVNVIVYEGKEIEAVVVPQAATLEDSDGKYVYVVDERGLAQQKRIRVGKESGTDFVVEEGLQPGDEIIVNGIQKIMMPGMPVVVAQSGDAKANANSNSTGEQAQKSSAKGGNH
jgi:membrane fusion protein (multidrug efflux system)